MTYDPKKIRPKDGWALILAEPRETKLSSGIYLPGSETGAEKVTELAGEVITLGGGSFNDAMRKQGLVEGARALYRGFLKYANPLPTEDKWPDGSDKHYFFIDCKDILGIAAKDTHIGVFGGRPAAPHVTQATHTKENA